MKTLLIIASLVLVVLVGNIVLLLREGPKLPAPAPRKEERVELPPRTAPPPPTVDARPQIRQAIEEKRPQLRSAQDVSRYLDDLKAQARRNRAVTALEVETGVAAIRGHSEPEQAMAEVQRFRMEMAQLSAELEHRDLNDDKRPSDFPQPPSLN